MQKTQKRIPLGVLIWANIAKFQIIRGIDDKQLAGAMGITSICDHKKKHRITAAEMENICMCLDIQPEQLLER